MARDILTDRTFDANEIRRATYTIQTNIACCLGWVVINIVAARLLSHARLMGLSGAAVGMIACWLIALRDLRRGHVIRGVMNYVISGLGLLLVMGLFVPELSILFAFATFIFLAFGLSYAGRSTAGVVVGAAVFVAAALLFTSQVLRMKSGVNPDLLRWVNAIGMTMALAIDGVSFVALRATLEGRAQRLKEAKEQLQTSEERLRLAQQVAGVGTFERDIRSETVRWTPEIEALYGLPPGAFDNKRTSWESTVHPQDLATARSAAARAYQTMRPEGAEWRVIWPDGSTRWLEGRFQVLTDDEGNPERMVGVNIDITQRKDADERRRRAELALRENQEGLRITLNSIGDAVMATDGAGYVTRMNPVAERLTGWSLGNAIGKKLDEVFQIRNEETGEPLENPVEKVLRENRVIGLANHTVLVASDGIERVIADSGAPIRDECSEVHGVVLVFHDQTEQRRATRELERSEARFRRLYEAGIIGIIRTDLEGNILQSNDAFAKLLGYTAEEFLPGSVRWHELTPPYWRELDDRALEELKTTGVATPWEKELIRKDGAVVPVLVGVATLDAAASECIAFILDLTERKRTEKAVLDKERAEMANLAKTRFLANMSHELRTPLNAIMGFSEMLELESAGPLTATQKQYVSYVLQGGRHLLMLINDILDLSKVEAGHLALSIEQVSAEAIANDVYELVSPLAEEKRLTLTRSFGSALPAISVDALRFRQILYNLLSNAIKFTPPDGRVLFSVEAVGSTVHFAIEDNGVGIREEDRSRLFREFERLESTRTLDVEGTGLGLAITKKLVELHGGSIAVESQAGRGSTFTVTLPRESFAERDIQFANSHPPNAAAALVLVVETDRASRRLFHDVLRARGHRVLEATSVGEAVALLEGEAPDLILADERASGGGSMEILRVVRARPTMRGVPVVATTTATFHENSRSVVASGFDGVIVKPIDTFRVGREIERLVRRPTVR